LNLGKARQETVIKAASVYEHAWDLVVAGDAPEESENGDKDW
jgi:hypothetical protein